MDAEGVLVSVIQVRYRVARGRCARPGDADCRRPLAGAGLAIVQAILPDAPIARVGPGQGYLPVPRLRPQVGRPGQPLRRCTGGRGGIRRRAGRGGRIGRRRRRRAGRQHSVRRGPDFFRPRAALTAADRMDPEDVLVPVIQVRYRVARGHRARPGDAEYRRPLAGAGLAIVQAILPDAPIAWVIPGQGYLPVPRHCPQVGRPGQPLRRCIGRRGCVGRRISSQDGGPVAGAAAIVRPHPNLVLNSVFQPGYGVAGVGVLDGNHRAGIGPAFAHFAMLKFVPRYPTHRRVTDGYLPGPGDAPGGECRRKRRA